MCFRCFIRASAFTLQIVAGTGGIFQAKQVLAIAYLKCLRRNNPILPKYDAGSTDPEEFGCVVSKAEEELENPRPLSKDKNALDSVQVFGMDDEGNTLIARLARRNDRSADVWLYIRLNSGAEYQLPFQPNARVYNTAPDTFSAAGLTFEVLEPMRRWKISFNGLLRNNTRKNWKTKFGDDDDAEIVNGRFNFIWCPMNAPFDSRYSCDDWNLVDAVANEILTPSFIFRKLRLPDTNWYDQWGQMQGSITIDDDEKKELFLRGRKERKYGIGDLRFLYRYANLELYFKDGTTITIKSLSQKTGLSRTITGYVLHARGSSERIMRTNFDLDRLIEKGLSLKKFRLAILTASKKYRSMVKLEQPGFRVYVGDDWEVKVLVRKVTFTCGNIGGYGVLERGYRCDAGSLLYPTASIPYLQDVLGKVNTSLFAVEISDRRCCNSNLVGGKGMSLALMTSFSERRFVVPKGFCLTVVAFWNFIAAYPNIRNEIKHLQNMAWKVSDGYGEQACQRVVDIITATAIPNNMQARILFSMKSVFGEDYNDVTVAVRSSAVGEDGEETSFAGQYDTVLGVKGADSLWKALARCWASQFSFHAMEYKRNNGQLVNGGMGVVIQEMVPANKAGVLFTKDSFNRNPGQMVISANYGLGESVVDGSTVLDTVILKRTWRDVISFKKSAVGEKTVQIDLGAEGSTTKNVVSEAQSKVCCLSEEEAVRLGEMGLVLEKAFGRPMDIEWAIVGVQDYVLQCRPITTMYEKESEYLVTHEFDGAVLTDEEMYTKANVGEVYPGATTPLSLSTILVLFDSLGQRMSLKFDPHRIYPTFTTNTLVCCCSQVFYNILNMAGGVDEKVSKQTVAMGYSLMGRNFVDENLRQLKQNRHGKSTPCSTIIQLMPAIKEFFWSRLDKDVAKARHSFVDCIPIAPDDSSFTIYKNITKQFDILREAFAIHYFISMTASITQGVTYAMLTSDVGDADVGVEQVHKSNILYQSCVGVESAGVPTATEQIVAAIREENDWLEFSQMPVEDALWWLTENSGRPGDLFREFLVNHGHRCIKEFELRSKPWSQNQLSTVKSLQLYLINGAPEIRVKAPMTVSESIDELRTKFSVIKRFILWHIVNIGRKVVGRREISKSMIIAGVHTWRLAYQRLSQQMVAEGRIPDDDLIYFFTHYEIGKLLRTRSARLLKRAQGRKDMHPKLNDKMFPVLSAGLPKEELREVIDFAARDPLMTLQATPTGVGVAEGPARVILSIDDALQIQKGDILITCSTDIGWTPYFNLLAAVVTELGGVISHGTVVARECGIPSIICATRATVVFKSGDLVRVDGNRGTIQLLQHAPVEDADEGAGADAVENEGAVAVANAHEA